MKKRCRFTNTEKKEILSNFSNKEAQIIITIK